MCVQKRRQSGPESGTAAWDTVAGKSSDISSAWAVRDISTVQYSTVQYSTVQYSTVQYSAVEYSASVRCELKQVKPLQNLDSS